MKKIIVLIILLVSATAVAQSWTGLKETNITVANNNVNYDYDIFTNGAGNHIIVKETNALKYYKMDVNGYFDPQIFPKNIESSSVITPSISGDATRIYIVYGINNEIRTKYSTNGGSNWSILSGSISANASFIESVVSKDKLHITYLLGNEVWYSYRLIPTGNWITPIKVSGTFDASNPRICVWNAGDENKVYITYNNGFFLRWRGYNIATGSWTNVNWKICQAYGFIPINLGTVADDTYLYAFWKNSLTSEFDWHVERISDEYSLGQGNSNGNTNVDKIFSTLTVNNKPYTAAWSELQDFQDRIVRMGFNYTKVLVCDEIYYNSNSNPVNIVNLSAAGNDVHVIWKDNLGTNGGNNLRYKYYDDVPVPPQNLTITKSANNHPYLSWINPNPDGISYKIYRVNFCSGGWELIGQTTNLYYEDQTQSYCTAVPPAQCENLCNFQYKIKTVDAGSKESNYSNIVDVSLVGGPPQKAGVEDPVVETVFEYSLGQNYPNPFNPTTTINYSIKSVGVVSLKVYDILGTEVASLVNEVKEAGNYSVTFNAANLPSGMYVYILSTGNFMDTKKLILLK